MTVTDRRRFLRDAAVATGGLTVAFHLPGCSSDSAADRWGQPGDLVPNANLRITPDNRVIFTLGRVEMGQGTLTSQTMIVAEELDLDPSLIEVEFAPAHADFAEPEFGVQVTGGSSSTRNGYAVLSQAGASARQALLLAAASELGVEEKSLSLQGKTVVHTESGRKKTFGELASKARAHVDTKATPKPRSEWKIVGKNHTRLDARSKVDGSAKFGADYNPPGMETAVIVRGPLGAKAEKIDDAAAKKVRGVKDVFDTPYGVAVVAEKYHQARKAADVLKIDWSASDFSTRAMFARYAKALDARQGAGNARSEGDADGTLKAADKVVEAEYRLPFLAHATMEPQNCTVALTKDGAEVWVPTQGPAQCAMVVSDITGIAMDKVTVHQTLLGGGFGRRSETDMVREAAHLAKVRKVPVRVQWSREDDMQNDFFRPASLHRLRGAVEDGKPQAWEHLVVQQTSLERPAKMFLREVMPSPLARMAVFAMTTTANDGTIIEGADSVPYDLANISVGYHAAEEPVPTGFWRSVGHSSNGFVTESFIDELAHAAGKDPYQFRRGLLSKHPRHLGVLELAARKANWGKPLLEGRAHGIAVCHSFHSYVAVVAEVSVEDADIKVHKLTAAVDCGTVIHPDGVKAQIEGGMVFALGPTLTEAEITFENGMVQQSNFHDFQTLRQTACPEIDVHIVESTEPPTGTGEPGVPPTAPAVANAVFALSGKRLRSLPLRLS